jgi:folate-binding protein YgfZ
VRVLFHLARLGDERLLLLLRGGRAIAVADALRRYVFRSRVTISAGDERPLGTTAAMPLHLVELDGATMYLGCGTHAMVIGAQHDDDWRLPQIRARWPWLPDTALDTFLPPALDLDVLHAVAIDKGCYPGQEIVARLHYRGGHKQHLHRVALSRPVAPGTRLRDGDHEMALLDIAAVDDHAEALAVMHDEHARMLGHTATVIADVTVRIIDTR